MLCVITMLTCHRYFSSPSLLRMPSFCLLFGHPYQRLCGVGLACCLERVPSPVLSDPWLGAFCSDDWYPERHSSFIVVSLYRQRNNWHGRRLYPTH